MVFKIPKKKSPDGKTLGLVENVPQLTAPLQDNVVAAHLDTMRRIQELKTEMAGLKRQQRIWDESAMFDLARRDQKSLVHGQHRIKVKTIREQPQFTLEKLSPGLARYLQEQGRIGNPRDALVFSVAALQYAAKTQERKYVTRIEIVVPVQKERKTKRTAEFVANIIEKKQRQKLQDSLAAAASASPFFSAPPPSSSASSSSPSIPQSAFPGHGAGSGARDAEGENHGMAVKDEDDDDGREVADD